MKGLLVEKQFPHDIEISPKLGCVALTDIAGACDLDQHVFHDGGGPCRHHNDPITQKYGLADAVCNEQHCLAGTLAEPRQIEGDFVSGERIKSAEWFIHKQDWWIVD